MKNTKPYTHIHKRTHRTIINYTKKNEQQKIYKINNKKKNQVSTIFKTSQ